MNLLLNAIKFCREGHIKLRASYSKSLKRLNFSVIDEGVGFKTEEIPLLFKKYSTLRSNENLNPKGVGLGLSICKKILKRMDGNIVGFKNPGKLGGAVFNFFLPAKKEISDSMILLPSSVRSELLDEPSKSLPLEQQRNIQILIV